MTFVDSLHKIIVYVIQHTTITVYVIQHKQLVVKLNTSCVFHTANAN